MRIVKNLLIVLIVLWGLLAFMVRSATPFIADYRDALAGLLAEKLGAPVTIDEVQARWHGVAPILEARRVRIGDAARALQIERVALDLALGELLTGSAPDALRLTVDGMRLTLVREDTGQLHLEGIGLIGQAPGRDRPLTTLPSGLRLLNTSVVWIDRKAGKPPFTIDNIDIILDREGSLLDLRARLETGSGNADLSARLDGFLGTRDWDGETYLKVDNLDVADLFAHYLPEAYGLDRLHLDLEAWGRWQDAAPIGSQGSFDLRDLALHPKSADAIPLDLTRASARFSMQRTGDELRVGLKDLRLALDRRAWPESNLAFAIRDQADGSRRISAAADYLRIDDLIRILQVRLPWPELGEPFARLQPRGEVRDLSLLIDTGTSPPAWRAHGAFSGLGSAPWGGIPGVDNLSGVAHGQSDHLVLQLDSRDARIRFSELFRDPLQLNRLQGRLDLLRGHGGWELLSEILAADSPHISTRTRLRLEHRPETPLFLDLQTDFSDGDASHALRYYPTGIMSEKVVAWLDSAIRSGRVPHGSALIHGQLDEFPFETSRSGTFQVIFDTSDLELAYYPGWPKLEQLDAHVRFHGNQLDIEAGDASVYDSRVSGTRAHIASLNPASTVQVKGTVHGSLNNILRLLQEDALRGDFGSIAGEMGAEGDAELNLEFAIPLSDTAAHALQGHLLFGQGAELVVPGWNIALHDIRGRLDFNLDGLSAKGIQAHAFGAPLTVDVSPLEDGTTRLQAQAALTTQDIHKQLPMLPLQLADGRSEYRIGVDIPPGGAANKRPTLLSVDSKLQGTRIALPAPFGKTAAQARPLAVRLPIGGAPAVAELSYADRVNAAFSSDGSRVNVVLGGGSAELAAEPGIRISGRLREVDLLAWTEALEPLQTGEASSPDAVALDLTVDQLGAEGVFVKDLQLRAQRQGGLWRGAVEAPNLAGHFVAAHRVGDTPVQIKLDRLGLELPLGEAPLAVSAIPDPSAGPDPTTLPGLSLEVAELRINQADLGRLRVNVQRAPEGLRLTQFSLRDGQLELDSAGHWSRIGTDYQTEWGGFLDTANLGDLLVDLGYSRQVEQAASHIEFLLRWPGDPAQFHRATVGGTVGLDVGTGRIVELDPGVTRVVGLLNLSALTRRLRLDFSDIYKKGYSFDSIQGNFRFDHGTGSTDDLRVLGPSGRIDLTGSADLVDGTLDQHVTVTPNLDATLPLAGTLAGGPVAGLAVLVAQKVMTKQVDQINRFEYSISGPWAEPEVMQLDTGGTLSKLLQPFSGGPGTPADQDQEPADARPGPSDPRSADIGQAQAPGASRLSPTAEPADTDRETQPADGNPLRGLLRIIRQSKSHGADLPGTSD